MCGTRNRLSSWHSNSLVTAIASIDKKLRRAYDLATEVFPDLVRRETKIMDFLRTEDYHAGKAALRLVLYWRYRQNIFQERWLLPMTQTGNGCLDATDVQLLRTGYCVIFPHGASSGGALIVYDHSRAKGFDHRLHMRISMYLCTNFTNEASQLLGGGCLYVVRSGDRPATDTNRDGWIMFLTAMPIRAPKKPLVVQAFEAGKEGILSFLAYQEMRTAQFRSQIQPNRLISDSFRGTLTLVEKEGIDRKYVPECLGGDFRYDQFHEWVRVRVSMEEIMSPLPLRQNKLATRILGGKYQRNKPDNNSLVQVTKRKRVMGGPDCSARAEKTSIDDESRKVQAMYSRRSYHKKKLTVLGLEEQAKALRAHQAKLLEESNRLGSLMGITLQILATYQIGTTATPPTTGTPSASSSDGFHFAQSMM